jgi:hypothetical protein
MVSISDFKYLYEILQKTGNLDAQRKILDLQQEQIEADGEILRLREENARLKHQAELKQKLKYEAPYYVAIDGDTRDGPFCQHCYDVNERLVRLQPWGGAGAWHCLGCQNSVYDRDYRVPECSSPGESSWLAV